ASFYGETAGPDISSMPYLNGRPSLGTLTMYIASKCDKVLDINTEDEVRVAMNVEGGMREDILEAAKCYKWTVKEGGALLVVRNDYEVVESHGFDAVLGVRSGVQTGSVVYECETPCITTEEAAAATEDGRDPQPLTLTLNYNVVNIKKDYPIEKIEVNNDNVEIDVNESYIVNMSVTPMASYAFQKVKVEIEDPTIVSMKDFEGYDLPIQGLKPGTTTIKFWAYNNTELVTKTMTVTVKDPIGSIVIDAVGDSYIFVGGNTTWTAKAYTLSGVLMNDVPMSWESSDNGVVTVANGVLSGVAAGSASVSAVSGDVKSGARSIRVIAAPEAINDASGFAGFYEDGEDIVFLDSNEGYLVISGGYADGEFAGSYNLSGAYYMNSDAKAPATGTISIAKGAGEYEYIVTMNVSINLSEEHKVSFVVDNGMIEYIPE
ncbi:MAG: Ig-like domain-containing protein, partial [Paramuribaculum sp.]|nr:Ig-like domain-containing protein [Paramuribaculum sp.]